MFFFLCLDYREISLYTYLLQCESRETYQCYRSYKNIGKAIVTHHPMLRFLR